MRERKMKPHNKLRALMEEFNVKCSELGELLGRSQVYISPRLNNKKPWSLDDVYEIIAHFNSFSEPGDPEIIGLHEIAKYFPPRCITHNKRG